MPLTYLDDPMLTLGMNRDDPSWLLPAGSCYDALNMLFDGPCRQRRGTTALVSGAQTAFATSIGFAYSQDTTVIEELYGLNGKTAALNLINKTTGAATSLGTFGPTGVVGRPARHFGFAVFPVAANPQVTHGAVSVAGQTVSTLFANSNAVASINAGNPQITLSGTDVTTNIKVGAVVAMAFQDVNLTNWAYWGRVVSIDTTKLFTVWPVPTITGTAAINGLVTGPARSSAAGGACAASFQNRLLLGNTMDLAASTPVRNDRRVIYSILPTETNGGNIGATFVDSGSWPRLNYFDVPGGQPIVALEPIDSGRLLILTTNDVMILSGNLVTQQSTTSPSITYDIYPFEVTSGCLSDLSVMRTPTGIMWAGAEGVFAYWPPIRRSLAHTGMRNLLDGKMLMYWLGLVNTPPFVIHGAAYAQNHYFISGTAGGVTWSLACNLQNNSWTRLSGAGTDIFNGVRRPSIPQQTFVARWWDQTGAAPSMTNGQAIRVETMFSQYVAGATAIDADGAAVSTSLTTRTITGDAETQKIFQRGTVRYQATMTAPNVSVITQSKIDAADYNASAARTVGTLSSTHTSTITNVTNANPIVVTTSAAHGLQTDDFVDIDNVVGNTNANGRYRIAVINSTSLSLVGGIGNAAYISGGTLKKITESDFALSTMNAGQGISFVIASTGAVNNLEIHGLRVAALQRAPVLSS